MREQDLKDTSQWGKDPGSAPQSAWTCSLDRTGLSLAVSYWVCGVGGVLAWVGGTETRGDFSSITQYC